MIHLQSDQNHALTESISDFIGLVSRVLPDDIMTRLAELRQLETGPLATAIYDSMFANLERAAVSKRPCCQRNCCRQQISSEVARSSKTIAFCAQPVR